MYIVAHGNEASGGQQNLYSEYEFTLDTIKVTGPKMIFKNYI